MKGQQLLELLLQFFDSYGYYVVFIGAFLENTLFVGLVIPGEVILLLAAFVASQGRFNVAAVAVLAFAGAFIASNIGYLVGRRGGRPFIERYGERLGISRRRIEAAERYFDEHGHHTVFVTRFTAGIKNFVPALAGASRMNYFIFLGYLTAGLIIWVVALSALGFFFGSNFSLLVRIVRAFGWAILIIIALIIGLLIYKRSRRRESK